MRGVMNHATFCSFHLMLDEADCLRGEVPLVDFEATFGQVEGHLDWALGHQVQLRREIILAKLVISRLRNACTVILLEHGIGAMELLVTRIVIYRLSFLLYFDLFHLSIVPVATILQRMIVVLLVPQ